MRGYQRRVIYLKNTGSALFDEAYFVVKEGGVAAAESGDMVSEATRIIEENLGDKKRRGRARSFREWMLFSFGFLGGVVAMLLVNLIIL